MKTFKSVSLAICYLINNKWDCDTKKVEDKLTKNKCAKVCGVYIFIDKYSILS